MTKKRPNEFEYASHVSYTRALEEYCNSLEKREWFPLSDEALDTAADKEEQAFGFIQGAAWAEKQLKEKNQ